MAQEITTSYRNSTQRLWNASDVSLLEGDIIPSAVANESGDQTDCKVMATSPTSANVKVKVGKVYIRNIDTGLEDVHTERLWVRVERTLTVPANSTGDIRVDAVIARIDVDGEPDAEADNNGTIEILTGTGNVALTDNAIQTIVGDDGWYRLADINTPNSFTVITQGNITDTRLGLRTWNMDLYLTEGYKMTGKGTFSGDTVTVGQMADDGADDYFEFQTWPRQEGLGSPTEDRHYTTKDYVDDQLGAFQGVVEGQYGDGSDGSIHFDGTTAAVSGVFSKVSTTYTLLRDVFFTDILLDVGITLKPDGYKIYYNGTFENNGLVDRTGQTGGTGNNGGGGSSTSPTSPGGSGGTGGTAPSSMNAGSLGAPVASKAGSNGGVGRSPDGSAGADGTAGVAGNNVAQSLYAVSGTGSPVAGNGGSGAGTGANGGKNGGAVAAGGTATALTSDEGSYRELVTRSMYRSHPANGTPQSLKGVAGSAGAPGGGGGGGANGAGAGGTYGPSGGGGGGGGASGENGGAIFVRGPILTGSGEFRSHGGIGGGGGNGGNGTTRDNDGTMQSGGGGGGSAGPGGGGGIITIECPDRSDWSGTVSVTGGAAGSAGTGGTKGGASAGNGVTGGTASAGPDGTIYYFPA